MKFNEKLIKLRKKEGLSQEELGEKLCVTRQTISKWELGETTPEMSKLLEIANVFGASVDELTNGNEMYNINEIKQEKSKDKSIKFIIIAIVLLGIIFLFIIGLFTGKVFSRISSIREFVIEFIDKSKGAFNTTIHQMQQTQAEYDERKKEKPIKDFNNKFTPYIKTGNGYTAQTLLDKVIQSNQENDRKVMVKYINTETLDAAELRQMKRSFDDAFDKFEIYAEYDSDGFINKILIEKI